MISFSGYFQPAVLPSCELVQDPKRACDGRCLRAERAGPWFPSAHLEGKDLWDGRLAEQMIWGPGVWSRFAESFPFFRAVPSLFTRIHPAPSRGESEIPSSYLSNLLVFARPGHSWQTWDLNLPLLSHPDALALTGSSFCFLGTVTFLLHLPCRGCP